MGLCRKWPTTFQKREPLVSPCLKSNAPGPAYNDIDVFDMISQFENRAASNRCTRGLGECRPNSGGGGGGGSPPGSRQL